METNTKISTISPQDEHILAALSHIGILLPMIGILVPIIIWVTQKEKSRFVAFQALQATVYHLVLIVLWFVGMACYMASFFLVFAGGIAGSQSNRVTGPLFAGFFLMPFLVFGAIFLGYGILVIYGIVAAVLTFQGKDFRYLLIGRWVERYSQPKNGIA